MKDPALVVRYHTEALYTLQWYHELIYMKKGGLEGIIKGGCLQGW